MQIALILRLTQFANISEKPQQNSAIQDNFHGRNRHLSLKLLIHSLHNLFQEITVRTFRRQHQDGERYFRYHRTGFQQRQARALPAHVFRIDLHFYFREFSAQKHRRNKAANVCRCEIMTIKMRLSRRRLG